MKNTSNIWYKARMEAAARDRLFANRARAADELYVSAEALADYERARFPTLPPCDVVRRMIEVYGTHWLRGAHVQANCPLMTECASEMSELQRAALSWVAQLTGATEIAFEFAAVARDGRISDDEMDKALMIRQKAVEMAKTMQETIAAIDTALTGRQRRDTP